MVDIFGVCRIHVAVSLQPVATRPTGSHLFSQGLQSIPQASYPARGVGLSPSEWISITWGASGTSITGRLGAGAAFALAFAAAVANTSEAAKLGVGDTLLVALVDLVGVAGAVGVVGALVVLWDLRG